MFVRDTCGCNFSNGKPCSKAFTREHIESIRNQCLGLDHASLDLLLMGSIMANTSDSLTAICSGLQTKQREKPRTKYYHHGVRVNRKLP